jgi:long-chain acyl-CoA synthetase
MLSSLGEILSRAAAAYGDKCALITGDRRLSFVELNDLSDRLAKGLTGLGIAPGDRVTLYAPNSWEWMVSYYAILKLGAVINPISSLLTAEEVEYVVADCSARAIVASRDKADAVMPLLKRPGVDTVVLFGEEAPAGARSLSELLAAHRPGFDIAPATAESLSTICYTSGTTGHPKGAMQSHRSIILSAAMTAQMHHRTSADSVVSALPCPHVYGNVVFNSAMMYGMTLILHPRFVAEDILESVSRHRATMIEGVPTMYFYLLNHPTLDRYDLSSLTRCTVGGQTMPEAKAKEVERRFGCPLLELWGMTEVAGPGSSPPLYGINKHGSIGLPLPMNEARIVAVDDASVQLPIGEIGEMMYRGPLVMQGYYGKEEATREAIEPDGWLHTGDLARMDEDGYIYIVDRKKDMIVVAGYNVYPLEVERVIAAHPSVAMVGVGPKIDELKGEIPKAYIVVKQGAQGDAEAIIRFCREHLAAYKIPRAVQFVSDLPKTGSGKIMRRELKKLDE